MLEDTAVDRPAFHLAVRTLILTDRVSQAEAAIATTIVAVPAGHLPTATATAP